MKKILISAAALLFAAGMVKNKKKIRKNSEML